MNEAAQPAKAHTGDLRRLTLFIRVAIAFFGATLIAIIGYTGWTANKNAIAGEKMLLDNALNQTIARMLNEQKSVAWWDDSVTNISKKKFDLDFIDTNFGVFLTETYGQNEVYILDPDNKPVYAYMDGGRAAPSTFDKRTDGIMPLVNEIRDNAAAGLSRRPDTFAAGQGGYSYGKLDDARWSGHVLSIDGRPAIVSGITIIPTVNMSLLKGRPYLLVSIAYIDNAVVAGLARSLLMSDLTLAAKPNFANGHVVQPFITDNGVLSGYLTWTPRRPGQMLLGVILPLVIIAVIGAATLSSNLLRRMRGASTELADREALARYEAKHDALSGLPNRHHYAETLNANLQALAKGGDGLCLVSYIDLDRFKDINDTLGHHAGDALIRAVAHRLRSVLKPNDMLSRFGGDEFAVMRYPATAGDAHDLAETLTRAFNEPLIVVGQPIKMTASIGIASAPMHGDTADQLMRHADIALYEAKARGRDRAVFFAADMAWDLEDRRAIEVDLRQAIEQDALTINWQPIISTLTGKTIGVEALLRWLHPTRGYLSPAVFVPIAEDSGLMPRLGAWAIDRALAEGKRWPHLKISINLSPVQFRHVDLEQELPLALARHGVDSRRIVLEVTEGVLLETSNRTRQVIEGLRRMGFEVALDDFGTGYSSLGYLCNFGFDKIKIDRSFVRGISEHRKLKTIVQAVVTIGRGLGMRIVAEGVETESEAAMMRLFGCNEMQGFFFSRPLDAKSIDARLMAEQTEPDRPVRAAAAH